MRENRITLLGTGTSNGVPVLGCDCPVCTSDNPKDKRTRVSALLQTRSASTEPWASVLLDASIDLRAQLLREGAPHVSSVVFTHDHMDHCFGLDELRPLQYFTHRPVEVYGSAATLERLQRVYAHLFDDNVQKGGGILAVGLHPVIDRFEVEDFQLLPLPVYHGRLPILGYRWGSLVYITDCSLIPDSTWPMLAGVRTLVLNALRKEPHETHFNLEQAVAVAERLQPEQTWFIHMTHNLSHEETNSELPEGIRLAHDGLTVNLEGFDPSAWS